MCDLLMKEAVVGRAVYTILCFSVFKLQNYLKLFQKVTNRVVSILTHSVLPVHVQVYI